MQVRLLACMFFFFQAEDGIRDLTVTGVQTCALPISGYRVVPVNPGHATILGEKSYPTLTAAAADQAIDVVDVFRRSEYVGTIVDDAIGPDPPPRLIWLQVGLFNHAARGPALAAGHPCGLARCLMLSHR